VNLQIIRNKSDITQLWYKENLGWRIGPECNCCTNCITGLDLFLFLRRGGYNSGTDTTTVAHFDLVSHFWGMLTTWSYFELWVLFSWNFVEHFPILTVVGWNLELTMRSRAILQ
jgi:hypothetical protein